MQAQIKLEQKQAHTKPLAIVKRSKDKQPTSTPQTILQSVIKRKRKAQLIAQLVQDTPRSKTKSRGKTAREHWGNKCNKKRPNWC